MPLLYTIATGLYHWGIRAAAPFNPKAKAWVEGRRGTWQRLQSKADVLQGCVWMHCASVGEFEQGLPVVEELKRKQPGLPVLITFFSPSGYEARKEHPLATHVEYLPPDSAANASRLVELVHPRVTVFVKYEFWYHHLHALKAAGTPVFLISALFRPGQLFFRWYGAAWRSMLRCYTRIFTQDEASRRLLAEIGITNAETVGDTRPDRVLRIVESDEALPIAAAFRGSHRVLVCGSTWPADEDLLLEALGKEPSASQYKLMVVPHELKPEQLQRIEARFPKPLVRWSELEGSSPENIAATLGHEAQGTLLVDRMGLLARLYKYADVAYVGGGFGDGIHSVLEAAAWGKPVLFGPKHVKFTEAAGLIAAGAAHEVRDAGTLAAPLETLFGDAAALANASQAARNYVQEKAGATRTIAATIGDRL
ncbi:MAG: 3-deoxy-D-manno-octulosonic acid transferase [Flavobacteriales bacterium]|nr:MAG: 3-deoxy-D-manno-octulosonic acid transferase [Flavobacteriales bacterium]